MGFFGWLSTRPSVHALEWRVRRALYGDPRLRDFDAPRIEIVTEPDGRVELRGAVRDAAARELARHVTREVSGVSDVSVSLRTDADLTSELRERLKAQPRLQALAADSVVCRGIAELRGPATYDAQLAAIKLSGSIPGVRHVENYMQLATSAAATRQVA